MQAVVHWRKVSRYDDPARVDPPRRDQPRPQPAPLPPASGRAGRTHRRRRRPRRSRPPEPDDDLVALVAALPPATTARPLALLLRRPLGRRSRRRDEAQRRRREVPPARGARVARAVTWDTAMTPDEDRVPDERSDRVSGAPCARRDRGIRCPGRVVVGRHSVPRPDRSAPAASRHSDSRARSSSSVAAPRLPPAAHDRRPRERRGSGTTSTRDLNASSAPDRRPATSSVAASSRTT